MKEKEFIKQYGRTPIIEISYYVDSNGNVVIDEENTLKSLEQIKLECEDM